MKSCLKFAILLHILAITAGNPPPISPLSHDTSIFVISSICMMLCKMYRNKLFCQNYLTKYLWQRSTTFWYSLAYLKTKICLRPHLNRSFILDPEVHRTDVNFIPNNNKEKKKKEKTLRFL